MAQFARPDQTTDAGNWTDKSGGATLHTSIDEASANNNTDYIKVTDNGSNEECTVRLGDVDTPDSGNAFIKYRALRDDNTGMGGPTLKIELVQGSPVKATTTNTGVDLSNWTDYSFTISDVSGISDWTDLSFKITALTGDGAGMGAGDEMKITQIYLETQDAAASAAPAAEPDMPGAAFLLFLD